MWRSFWEMILEKKVGVLYLTVSRDSVICEKSGKYSSDESNVELEENYRANYYVLSPMKEPRCHNSQQED